MEEEIKENEAKEKESGHVDGKAVEDSAWIVKVAAQLKLNTRRTQADHSKSDINLVFKNPYQSLRNYLAMFSKLQSQAKFLQINSTINKNMIQAEEAVTRFKEMIKNTESIRENMEKDCEGQPLHVKLCVLHYGQNQTKTAHYSSKSR